MITCPPGKAPKTATDTVPRWPESSPPQQIPSQRRLQRRRPRRPIDQHPPVQHQVRAESGPVDLRCRRRRHHGESRPDGRGPRRIGDQHLLCRLPPYRIRARRRRTWRGARLRRRHQECRRGGSRRKQRSRAVPRTASRSNWDTATVVVSPAWYDDYVLTVGSIDAHGEPSSFTLAGPWVDVAAPGEGVVSLSSSGIGLANALGGKQGPVPLSGTSYAAPVVSGLAALIRSRFPQLTARQVMQRITATAHHPPGRRDPRVGAGPVDFLAAVSTDTLSSTALHPPPASVPVPAPVGPEPPDHRAKHTAFTGAAVCGGVLVAVLIASVLLTRLRRPTPAGRKS